MFPVRATWPTYLILLGIIILILFLKCPASHHAGTKGEYYSSYSFLTLAFNGANGQRHASAALYPRERIPGARCIGGWLGLKAGEEV
jgi:hypothetical protein